MKRSEILITLVIGIVFVAVIAIATYFILSNFVASNIGVTI